MFTDVIKQVKRAKVCCQGKAPQARRSCTKVEFLKTQSLLKEDGECLKIKYGILAFNNFHYHMISRVENCTQFVMQNIELHPHFNFAIKAKLCWSKNVQEKQNAPWQVALGSMETPFCILVSLALWLEILISSMVYGLNTSDVFTFNNSVMIPDGGKKSSN